MRTHHLRTQHRSSLLNGVLLLAGLAIGCSDSDGGGSDKPDAGFCPRTGPGTLTVNIVGLPEGVNAAVKVRGPSGREQSLTSSQVLAESAAGNYGVSADQVVPADAIVRTVYAAPIATEQKSFCVGAAGKTVEVSYAPIATSNKLWIAVSNAPAGAGTQGFASATLAVTGEPPASVAITSGAGRKLAFDRAGNLWASGGTTADPHVLRLPAAMLGASGRKEPDRKINIKGLDCLPAISGLAFDREGALWVASTCKGRLFKLSAGDLGDSSDVTPTVSIAFPGALALAFDRSGNLWVSTGDEGQLARFDAASLGSATATPALVLAPKREAGGAALKPGLLAIDANGDLWSTDFGGNVIFRLLKAEPGGASGPREVVPPVQLTLGVLALLEGIALDEGGGLWVTYSQGKVARLSPAQLTVSTGAGAPTTPERVISSASLGYAEDLAFFPAPTALPLYSALP
ncbi:MAG: hypothetical protein IPG96_08395 [Proteobacteria bacterium]|nr:hypothetical protein [Pseudomonadota bacterium]